MYFGSWLQAGDLIAIIYDAFGGDRRAEIRAPLSGIRRQPSPYEGDLVALLQTRMAVEGASRVVRGQQQ